MKDDRLRVPVDNPYVVALGRAAYVFATLEWNAVWCAERLEPGFINSLNEKTAGKIANDLLALVGRIIDPAVKAACEPPALRLQKLVGARNGILHGKPGTAPDQSQRLFRDGSIWNVSDLDDAADDFRRMQRSVKRLAIWRASRRSDARAFAVSAQFALDGVYLGRLSRLNV